MMRKETQFWFTGLAINNPESASVASFQHETQNPHYCFASPGRESNREAKNPQKFGFSTGSDKGIVGAFCVMM